MFTSLAMSASIAARRPQLLAVPLAAALILAGIFLMAGGIASDLLVSALFLEILPDTGFFEFPWHFYAMYSGHLNFLAIALLAGMAVFTGVGFFFAKYAKASTDKEESMLGAARETAGMAKAIIALVIFFFIIGLGMIIGFWWIVNATISLGAIGILFPIIALLAAFYIYITLLFVPSIMAVENASIKDAIQKSYYFAGKRLWGVVVFGFVVGLVNSAILWAGESVSNAVPDDTISIIVFAIFWAIAVAYVSLAVPIYYLRKSRT